MVAAARKGIRAASRIALPRRVEDRNRATEREPSELDERVVQTDRGAANGAGRAVVNRRPPGEVLVCAKKSWKVTSTDILTAGPGEDHVREGAQHAVLGRGAGID